MVKLLSPFAPHLADELWEMLGNKTDLAFEKWPEFDEKALLLSNVNIVISVNGKKRLEVEMPVDLSSSEMEEKVRELDALKPYLQGKEIKKIIVVPNKLVNIVI